MRDKRIRTRIKRLSLVSRNMKTIANIRRRFILKLEKHLGRKLKPDETARVIYGIQHDLRMCVDYWHKHGHERIHLRKITCPPCKPQQQILGNYGQVIVDEFTFRPINLDLLKQPTDLTL